MVKLTEFARGGGCGCKVAPAELQKMLAGLRQGGQGALLLGNVNNDDAAVWDLGQGQLLLSTTDFFLPVVDDAFDFGRISAVNALSDIYAMGGKPAFALAILGWPVEKLGAELASIVLSGASKACAEAGIPLAGGHTIDATEPFFGLAVNGFCESKHLKTNGGAQSGDSLYLSKPLGVGMVNAALKRGILPGAELFEKALASMLKLNRVGENLGRVEGVHAMTDVTGFGLAGHLFEICKSSGLQARLNLASVPRLEGLEALMKLYVFPDMTTRNFNAFKESMSDLSAEALMLLCDPQTSGGLLIAAAPEAASEVEEILRLEDCCINPIGTLLSGSEPYIFVE